MDSRSNRRRMNVEGDKLSSLPDDLIAKILSYNSIKQAVETSVLSSRWKYIWISIPYLNFSSEDFSNKAPKFYRFLTHVFSSCNDQVEFSLNLCGKVSQVFIKKILKVACSRNVQKLTFSVLHENRIELDLSLISSQSLKHLSLIGSDRDHCIMPTSMWKLPALTTLHLDRFTLYEDDTNKCVGLFSKCANLKNQPSPFLNLQSLKIYPAVLHDSFQDEVTIPTEVKNYLLESSPNATFTMVSRKELKAVRDAKLAQDLMEELRLLLDQEKAQMKSRKEVMKPQPMKKMPLDMSKRVTQIQNDWAALSEQIDVGKRKTIPIIKLIQRIKDLLIKLPVSKKDEM